MVQQNAECDTSTQTHRRKDICGGDCTLPINREVAGVANCFELVHADSECGNKWFEVGDNLCMCYLTGLVECDIESDEGENLYRIG